MSKPTNRGLLLRLSAFVVAMFAFGIFALPPLYDAFCEVTGLGGKTNSKAFSGVVDNAPGDEGIGRPLAMEFVTTVNQAAPYDFWPAEPGMKIRAGGLYEATFMARNKTDKPRIAQAVPSVSPAEAAKFVKKLECFCFSQQEFESGEEKAMPVRFVIGSDLPDHIDTITLSYTFFDAANATHEMPEGMSHPTR